MVGAQRPSQPQVQQFLNLPQQGGKGLSDPGKVGVGVAAGALGYAGAKQLLGGETPGGERPGLGDRGGLGERPGAGDRLQAGTLPAERPGASGRPGAGERPGIGERPGGGERPRSVAVKAKCRPNSGQSSGQVRQSFYAPVVEGSSQYGQGLLAKLRKISIRTQSLVEACSLGFLGRLGGRKFLGLPGLL